MANRLQDKVAIVTGGASGIGLGIARGFAAEGARVCIADLSTDGCARAAASIGGGCFGLPVDVRERDSVERLVAAVAERAGRLDMLVHCAGVFGMQAFLDVTSDEFERIMNVNARGALFTMQAAARRMIEQGAGGSIVNIASGVARRPAPGAASYSASKAALVSLTQVAAQELIRHGIRVNAIAPGAVRTPMWTQVDADFSRVLGVPPGAAESAQVAATPVGRMADPADFVGAAVFLASSESAYVVGQTLNVDGGMNFG